MKKELAKVLDKLSGEYGNDKVSIELNKCECCGDYYGKITNNESEMDWDISIENASDMMEFEYMCLLITGDSIMNIKAIASDMKHKKYEKLWKDFETHVLDAE